MKKRTIALVGNPNVGKSTIFNALTGMKQHTGNWPGKTVGNASGHMDYKNISFIFIDLPGAYSLSSDSPDEKVTGDYIASNKADTVLIVADATCLERNLILVRDVLAVADSAVLCVNLIDEAEKKGIIVDTDKLTEILKIPVISTAARAGKGLNNLMDALLTAPRNIWKQTNEENCTSHLHSIPPVSFIYKRSVRLNSSEPNAFDRKLDKILTSRYFGFPIMFLLLLVIFWITMVGANYPSELLAAMFSAIEEKLHYILEYLSLPYELRSFLMDGIYKTVTWVISVMLPPMAIFFPLFTLLEDFGYLPRVAFNLDNTFKRCGAHGKQALTMCMGFGCNACGVMGCRIIESPRERLIAIITNNFVPCNGRFPTLIAIITIFFASHFGSMKSAAAGIILSLFILLGILVTFAVASLLSKTILKGVPSSFVLELPPYRRPKFLDVIVRSMLDRTVFVLARAVAVALPAGAVIWILANINIGDTSILKICTDFLEPFGNFIGVDGVIIMAFILGFPANETVIPVMLMCYMSSGMLTDYSGLIQLQEILTGCGWDMKTALCVLILCMFHFPCGTTCLTIKKETGSFKWTVIAFIIPTLTGISICALINVIFRFCEFII